MRWTASNQYQDDKRLGSVVGQSEHNRQLLRMLEETNKNNLSIDGVKLKVCGTITGK